AIGWCGEAIGRMRLRRRANNPCRITRSKCSVLCNGREMKRHFTGFSSRIPKRCTDLPTHQSRDKTKQDDYENKILMADFYCKCHIALYGYGAGGARLARWQARYLGGSLSSRRKYRRACTQHCPGTGQKAQYPRHC